MALSAGFWCLTGNIDRLVWPRERDRKHEKEGKRARDPFARVKKWHKERETERWTSDLGRGTAAQPDLFSSNSGFNLICCS